MRELGSKEVFKRNDSIGAILYIGGSHFVEGIFSRVEKFLDRTQCYPHDIMKGDSKGSAWS